MRQVVSVLLAALTVTATSASARAQQFQPSLADWRSDLRDVLRDLRTLHPDPYAKIGRLTFERRAREFEQSLPELDTDHRVAGLMRLIASLGDGHTYLEMNNPAYARWYPIRAYQFSDGFYIIAAHKSLADLAGGQLLEIGGQPVQKVALDASATIGYENESMRAERIYPLHSETLMRGLGYADTKGLRLKVKLGNGRVIERTVQAMQADHPRFKDDATWEWQFRPIFFGTPVGPEEDWVTAFRGAKASAFLVADSARPPYLMESKAFSSRYIPERKTIYARTNYISDTDFVPFFIRVLAQADSVRPDKLIIDWRYNFGGDGSHVSLLMREFVKRLDNPPWKDIYLLTGRKTFSAAILSLAEVVKFVPVSIVGEPTAAALNHFGDPTSRTYPRTGLKLSVSTLWHQKSSSDDLREFFPVDVPAVFSFADFTEGRDPAVDAIIRGDEMRSLPMIARRDGGDAARKAYEDRRKRFGSIAWWGPPTEFEMRQACDQLQREKRFQEAVATCRLTADIHPTIWNVWYNLGAAQRAAGLMKERLASYRCVVAIAPDNWNVPAIRRLLGQPGNEGSELAPGCPGT